MITHARSRPPAFHRRRLGVLALVACSLAAPAYAQHPPSRFDAIAEVAKRELADTRTPGAAIALVDGDRVVFATGVGVADVETGAPIRPEMLFRLGSTTKMFTAAALVTLAEEKGVPLDRPIGSILPGLHASIAALTPHQLLSHTAGLRDEAPMFGRQDDSALGDGVRAMSAAMLFTTPAAIYSYSNPGYWIAGHVIEQLSGTAYADALQERVFAPLGMTRSTFRPTLAMTYPMAQGHEAPANAPAVIRPAANNTATWPAGSLFSNVSDLSKFVIAFMNQGRLDGREVLRPMAIKKLSSPQVSIPGGAASYGYGLQLSEAGGVALVSHGGSRAGYGSTITMVPSRRVAAIALGNRSGSGLPLTTRRAVEMLLGVADGALRPSQPTTLAAAAGAADGWAGRYTQGSGGGIEIAVKDGRLVIREGGRDQPATPMSGLRLAVGDTGPPWVLVPGRDGRPEYVFRGGRAFKRVQ
jgi:CubicO group peptidase (beta-lactamase class C family)